LIQRREKGLMKVAVTGASGFIGQYVLNELEKRKIETIAITRNANNFNNFPWLKDIIEFDISNPKPDDFETIHRPDVLIHLAWDGLPQYKSNRHFEIELLKQYNFLKNLIQNGLSSLIVTGTCFEYGMQYGELREDFPTLPNNPYGYAKDALRRQLEFLQSELKFSLTWTRLFYTYGEGQHQGSLYPQLKEAVLRGDPTFNMSGGEQLRDYLPVEEIARLIVLIACKKANFGIVNICSGTPVSIRYLVERWLRENQWKISLNLGHYPYSDYEPMAFWGSREKLNGILKTM